MFIKLPFTLQFIPFRKCYSTLTRQDGKWDYLRSDTELKKKIGDFIELPILPGELPKGLKYNDISRFLITQQRWKIAEEVTQAIGNGLLKERVDNGLCLSGPHGVGKSAINYFLACIAFVRGWFLQYIPLCGNWVRIPSGDARANFYIERFNQLNEDLLNSVSKNFLNYPEHTLTDVLNLELPLVDKQERLENFLSRVDEKPVLYLFDEHNELWKEHPTEHYVPAALPYFRTFTSWTRLNGPRLYIIYSGSAHSKFEENLPSGEEGKVRYIHPFKKEEACKLIEDLKIPKKFSLSAETVYDEITGGVPRQIVNLSKAENWELWYKDQEQIYYTLAEKTFSEMKTVKQDSFIKYLEQMFGPSSNIGKPPSLWYDKGLFYIEKGCTHMINPMAESAAFSLWTQYLQREIIDKPGMTRSEIGAVFEREVIKGFIHLPQIELQPFYMIKDDKLQISSGLLKLSRVDRIIHFNNEKDIPRLPTLACNLLKPKSQIFKAWDFIIEDIHTKQIVFIQTTIQFPDVHDKNKEGTSKIERAFIHINSGSNQIETILDTLFQTTGTKVYNDNGSFVVTLPVPNWSVKFLCVTSKHDIELRNRKWEWKDILVAGQETLKPLLLTFNKVI